MLECENVLSGKKDGTGYFDIQAAWLLTCCKILNNDTGSPTANLGPISSQLFILVSHSAG